MSPEPRGNVSRGGCARCGDGSTESQVAGVAAALISQRESLHPALLPPIPPPTALTAFPLWVGDHDR